MKASSVLPANIQTQIRSIAYLYSFRFPPFPIRWPGNTHFMLFVMFINLRNTPTARTITHRCRHVTGNCFLVDTFQNKCSWICLVSNAHRIECLFTCSILFWKIYQLLWSSWSINYFGLAGHGRAHRWLSFTHDVSRVTYLQLIEPVMPCKNYV